VDSTWVHPDGALIVGVPRELTAATSVSPSVTPVGRPTVRDVAVVAVVTAADDAPTNAALPPPPPPPPAVTVMVLTADVSEPAEFDAVRVTS
jgi:hypothetical protein